MTDHAPSAVTFREVVGVFHTQEEFEAAADDLLANGFDRSELSVLAGHKAVEEKLGHLYDNVSQLEDDPQAPRAAYVEKDSADEARTGTVGGFAYVGALAAMGGIVASGAALGWAIFGAVVFGGGGVAVGAWLNRRVGKDNALSVEEQLAGGGLLLWVRVRDAEYERLALEILERHAGDDVHVHEFPVPTESKKNRF